MVGGGDGRVDAVIRSYRFDHINFPDAREVCIAEGARSQEAEAWGVQQRYPDRTMCQRSSDKSSSRFQRLRYRRLRSCVAGDVPYSYSLYAGAHRFYLSIAAGFTHVPAID